jgi:hypothetical protein
VVKIAAIACESPKRSDRPVSYWTPSELASEAIKRGIVEKISPHGGAFFKKKPHCNPIDIVIPFLRN